MASYPDDGRPAVLSNEQHEEWLLDDAIDDTFPASDPVSLGQPGSIVNLRYAALEDARRRRRRAANAITPWLLMVSLVGCGLLLSRRNRRNHRVRP
ncbi:MAG TPA: hypothetical protein VFA81_12350 [Burkholderiales bacterium]|nr:hypothetical protein [Burkholderiales bacterium]